MANASLMLELPLKTAKNPCYAPGTYAHSKTPGQPQAALIQAEAGKSMQHSLFYRRNSLKWLIKADVYIAFISRFKFYAVAKRKHSSPALCCSNRTAAYRHEYAIYSKIMKNISYIKWLLGQKMCLKMPLFLAIF